MANDYVFMVCACREHFRLFGYSPSFGLQTRGLESLTRFEKWMFEHRFCVSEEWDEFAMDLGDNPRISLRTQSMMDSEHEADAKVKAERDGEAE
jgi:hypothetical protein